LFSYVNDLVSYVNEPVWIVFICIRYDLKIMNYELKTLSIQLNFKIKKVWKLKKYLSIFRIEITAIAI